jgi:hypothetical protein
MTTWDLAVGRSQDIESRRNTTIEHSPQFRCYFRRYRKGLESP